MKSDDKVDHWQKWNEIRREAEAKSREAREAGKMSHYAIVIVDGVEHIHYPWRQLLVADGASSYFWGLLQDMQSNMNDEGIAKFLKESSLDDKSFNAFLSKFCRWVEDAAIKKYEDREQKIEDEYIESQKSIRTLITNNESSGE